MAIDPDFIQHSTGKKLAGVLLTDEEAQQVIREEIVLGDPDATQAAARARVVNTHPAATVYGGVVRSIDAVPGTAAVTAPTMTAASATEILAANATRKAANIVNDSGSHELFVKYGPTASSTSYTHRIPPLGEKLCFYTGQITGRLATGATDAAAMTTELT